MPVEKFRTFDDATRSMVRADGDADRRSVVHRIRGLWAFSARLTSHLEFRGVRKYASIEDADADRDRMTIARAR